MKRHITVITGRTITLEWTAAESATRYPIWYSFDNIHWHYLAVASTPTYTLNGASSSHNNVIFENLGEDRKLWFRVASCNGTAFELSQDYATLEVTVPEFELSPPSNLKVTMIGTAGVKLSWTGTTNSTKQYILQYKINDGNWSSGGMYWTPGTGATSGTFPDTNYLMSLTPNAEYTFRIKTCISTAGDDRGKSSSWCYSEPVRTPEQCELATPTNLAKSGTSPSYTWTWDTVENATHYYVNGYAFTGGGGSLPTNVVSTNSYTSTTSYIGTRFTITAMNKTTLQRSEASQTLVSDITMSSIPMVSPFKTATTLGLNVSHANYFNYGSHVYIDYKKADDTEWKAVTRIGSSASTSPTFVNQLEPGTTYQFRASYVNFQNSVPEPTILTITTHPSEFIKGYYSKGITTGFVAAKASKDLLEFYRSADGTAAFSKISQVDISQPFVYFNKEENLTLVGGKNRLYMSNDSVNWHRIDACGTIRDIHYDATADRYYFIDENARIFTATRTQLDSMTLLGPFIPTNVNSKSAKFAIRNKDDFAFAVTPTKTFTTI